MSSLEELRTAGAFVPEEPVRKSITFCLDGEHEHTAEVFVKQLSVGDHERIYLAADAKDRSRTAAVIHECIFLGEDGTERVPFKDAYKMHPVLGNALLKVISEVNGLTPAKN